MEKKRYDQLQQAGGSPVGLFHRCDSLAETPPTCCRGYDSLAGIPTACCCIAIRDSCGSLLQVLQLLIC